MQYNESFLKGSIPKALVKFAIPLMIANILQILYTTVDMYIVGRFAETADVSAVATAGMVMTCITMAISGFAMGVSVLVGQFAGARKPDDISKTVGTGIIFYIILAIVITVPILLLARPIVSLLNAPAEAVEQTHSYLTICCSGLVFIMGYNFVCSIMRGMGNSKAPMLFILVSSIVNIIGDIVLVSGFHMGAAGAALATVASQAISFVFALCYFKAKGSGFTLHRADIRLNSEFLKKIVKIGAPISLQEFLVNLSFVFITAIINGFSLGASAASGIVEKTFMFSCIPILAFSSAVASMSSHNIGAGQPERAVKAMWTGIKICLVFTILFNVLTFFRGDLVISIFSKDPDVIENGRLYIKSYAFDQIALSFVFIMNGYFNSCGHSVFTMVHSLITTFAIRVPLVAIISKIAGATLLHIGIAAPLSSLASIIICVIFLAHQKKKHKTQTLNT